MITAFITVKREIGQNRYIAKLIPLSAPDDEVDRIVEMMQSQYGPKNVKVKRGAELQKSIKDNRKLYDEMTKILDEILQEE